jgi:pantothenate kinase type III
MYERFTDRARKVMQLANQEARGFHHHYIGSEHILLGLLAEGNGVAACVLKSLDLDLPTVRVEIDKTVPPGESKSTIEKLPQSPHAKKIIEYSMEEARNLGHNYVGTEHILLGLLRKEDTRGAQSLVNLGVSLNELRHEVLDLLGHGMPAAPLAGRIFWRFTDRARKVMVLAEREARRLRHEYLGTEHLLLGLIKEDSGVAGNVLKNLHIDAHRIREEVERLIKRGDISVAGPLQHTPRVKRVLKQALQESHKLNHKYVGTEHLLIGLLSEIEGVAAQVLLNLKLNLGEVREETLELLRAGARTPTPNAVAKAEYEPSPSEAVILESIAEAENIIAVDIGNSRMKLGRFDWPLKEGEAALPIPAMMAEFPIEDRLGRIDIQCLFAWCDEHVWDKTAWCIASVHSGAANQLTESIAVWAKRSRVAFAIRRLTYQDLTMPIHVEEPARVGIDRLMAAVAAGRIRGNDKAAIVVDLGSAITVDLVTAQGAFAGGAILPGIAMSARALAEQTDALPHLPFDRLEKPPEAVGKSTAAAIEAGLYWGAVGAIRELIDRLSAGLPEPPEVFLTGGASPQVAELLNAERPVRHVPYLVLSGIAVTAEAAS